jgi:O-antigen ligase/Tfp pilus assembly protein PilF
MAQSSPPWAETPPSAFDAVLAKPLAAARWETLRRGRAIDVALVALTGAWIGFYLITPLPYIAVETFRATIVLHAVTGVVLVLYVSSLIARRRLSGGSPLDLPIMTMLAVLLVTTSTSLNWRVSLEVTLTMLMGMGVYYVLSDRDLLRRWQLELALMLAVLAAALRGLWIVGGDYLDWLRFSHAVNGSYGIFPPTVPKLHDVGDHPNLLGAILAMSLPFFAAMLFRRVPAAFRALAALGGAAVTIALFLSLTRSAWLGAAVGLGVSGMLWLALTEQGGKVFHSINFDTVRGRLALGGATIALALAIVAVAVAARSVNARPIWLFRESGSPRQDVIDAGASMFKDHPLLGTGPGVYGLLYPQYSGADPNHAIHSHNGYLQMAIDSGIPGVLAMFALAGAVVWLLVRGLRAAEGDAQLSLIACTGALCAFAVFSVFDAPNGFKGPLVALAAVGAVASLSYQEGRGRLDDARVDLVGGAQLVARAVVPIALVGLLITWGRLDVAHYAYSSSISGATANNWQQAVERGQRAVNLDPEFAIYRLQYGLTLGQAYLAGNPSLLPEAEAQLQRGLQLEPRSGIGHANLALLFAAQGDRQQAREQAITAIHFANSDVAIVLAAGTALEKTGWDNDAIDVYSQALYLDPNLANSAFWRGSEFRQSHFDAIFAHSVLVFNPCVVLDLLNAGAPIQSSTHALSDCTKHVIENQSDQGAKVTLGEALLQEGDLEGSFALIDDAVKRQPDFGPGRTALGRWYAAKGDIDHARHEWLRAGQLNETDALVFLGDSYPTGQVPQQVIDTLKSKLNGAGSYVQFDLPDILYYRFKFFRASPVQLMLPGDWQQAVPGPYALAQDALKRWAQAR